MAIELPLFACTRCGIVVATCKIDDEGESEFECPVCKNKEWEYIVPQTDYIRLW